MRAPLFKFTPWRIFLALRARTSRFARLQRSGRIRVGRGTYGTPEIHTFAGDETALIIGNYCSIASTSTFLLGGNHPTDRRSTFPIRQRLLGEVGGDGFPAYRGDTVVGHDVWIGHEALILGGSNIGDGAVIGARAVVAGEIPAFAIVVGNPAKIVGYRAAKEALVDEPLPWWFGTEAEIVASISYLNEERI